MGCILDMPSQTFVMSVGASYPLVVGAEIDGCANLFVHFRRPEGASIERIVAEALEPGPVAQSKNHLLAHVFLGVADYAMRVATGAWQPGMPYLQPDG